MENLLPFIIQSGIALLVFYLYFYFFLRKTKRFQLNRIYLLSSALMAVLIPFFSFPIFAKPESESVITVMLQEVSVVATYNIQPETKAFSYITDVYIGGVIIFLSIVIYKLFSICRTINKHKSINGKGYRFIELSERNMAYSFFRYVFISKESTKEEIISHELVHVKQSHSVDIIIINILQGILWFNPLIYLYKNAIQENHEYIADSEVIKHHSAGGYLQLLLTQTFRLATPISNNFAQSNLKKRIKMITNRSNKKYSLVRYISAFILPVIMIFAISACNNASTNQEKTEDVVDIKDVKSVTVDNKKEVTIVKKTEQEKSTCKTQEDEEVFMRVEQMPEYPGGMKALFKYLGSNVKYPVEAIKENIQGRVIVGFVINKDGSFSDVKVLRPVNKYLDAEALRVVKSMPKWKPGKQNGKEVRVSYNVPINFNLKS